MINVFLMTHRLCAWVINGRVHSVNPAFFLDSRVYLAPPGLFICLLSPHSCGSVISGTCLGLRTAPDRTPAIGARRGRVGGGERGSDAAARTGGQRRLSGCVWALHTRSHNCVNWSVHSKEAEPCLIDPQIYCTERQTHTFGQTAAGILITSHFIPHRESPTFIMQLTWTLELHVSLSAADSCFKCKAVWVFFFFAH